ncbi:MAG: 4Fe-4S dicluster domain-containing protein [Atribacterota bacterium]|nr:4Fe-4S dicluster domain-containing protein [Atribacterota bacterium]
MEVIRLKYEKNEIIKKDKSIEVCFKCSTCSKFCPVTQFVDRYNLEDSFVTQLFEAEKPEALHDVWMCCACEKCVITCPQDTNPTDVFTNLKEKAYQEGLAPAIVYRLVEQLLNDNIVYSLKFANMARKRLGLKELVKNEKTNKELKIIAQKTGLLKEEGKAKC